MSELYGDQYDSVSADAGRFFPDGLRRLSAAGLFLLLIGSMGTWAYRLGTRDANDVPVVRAMEGPTRVQPDDPGGLTAAHQGLEVNAVLAGQAAPAPADAARLDPAPVLLTAEDGPQGELVVAAPENFGSTDLLADDDLPMPLQDEGPATLALDAAPQPEAEAEAPGQTTLAAAIAAAVAVEPAPAPAAATAAPGAGPRRRPADLPVARAAAAAKPEAVSPAAAREVASAAPGARLVQLGAYDSEALTRQAWSALLARHGDLLGAKSLYVERTTANARVFYRLRVAGFDSNAQTGALCEALRARGVDCIPVTLQ